MKTFSIVLQQAVGLVLTCLFCHSLQAQMRVGQPVGALDGSAALEVSGGPYSNGSPYRGILPPKVALTQTTQASPVLSPAVGLLIYNTTKAGDVLPGYYYWEGSKWIRLSTTTGAARVAAAGDPIPAYTYSEAKALTTAPGTIFMLTEPGQEGLFRNSPVIPPNPSTGYPGDTVLANGIRDNNGNILSSGTVMIVGGQRYKRVLDNGSINVRWFGANSSGSTDASQAIQRAINYAKTLYATNGGSYRASILIPEGSYIISKTIDVTKTAGIVIKGDGSRYINTIIYGITGGAIFDFTGSNSSGCENLYLIAGVGWPTPSTIGVQFALNADASVGGFNCSVKNCYFQMIDMPTANNGIGSIGILNCRSEEFAVSDCVIRANIGCIFSNSSNLSAAGLSYTAKSPYATVASNQDGSMGVINFGGQNSIINLGKARPAMILNGTNSLNFHGYIARELGNGNGTEEAAILFCGPVTYNATISATIEIFSQLMRVKSPLLTSQINGVVANQINVGTSYPAGTNRPPVIDLSGGGQIQGCDISVTFGNGQQEIGNRYLFYNSGPEYAQIKNSNIICPHWTDNNYLANSALLANTENTSFKTNQPFDKKPLSVNAIVNNASFSTVGWTVGSYRQIVPTGVLSNAIVYVMKVTWGQNGVDNIVQSYIFPMSGTDFNPNGQALPVLTPTVISWSNTGRSISVRYKAPTVAGPTSYGLEASINRADMNNGTVTVSISPLL